MKLHPEFLPLIEWWNKSGKSIVSGAGIAAAICLGFYAWSAHKQALRVEANTALIESQEAIGLEQAAADYADTELAGAFKLRLAYQLYQDGAFESALNVYEELIGKLPVSVADIPVLGRAHCLESLERFGEAAEAYGKFADEHTDHYLTLDAKLGRIRSTYRMDDDKDTAVMKLKELLGGVNAADEDRVKASIDLIERWEKRSEKIAVND